MSELGAAQGLTNIGEEAKPSFAVFQDPSTLFLNRSKRLRELASGHILEAYLSFVAHVTEAQHTIQAALPAAVLPPASQIQEALDGRIPPLSRTAHDPGEGGELTLRRLLEALQQREIPKEASAAVESLAMASGEKLRQLMSSALKDVPAENAAERVLVLASLQVDFSRLAAKMAGLEIQPTADGACPVCGSAPMASMVVGWPEAHNTRFCSCSLCGTLWHVVRVKCVLCGSTEGIGYQSIEGKPETVKAETCDKCGRYVKILYQVKDHSLDPLGDDIASLDLDMLLADEGWKRGGQNLFLLGY
ncbi:MAG: formate dehydrogenase accessory protein FdhE [Rhodomicrobium sp.]